MKLVLEHLTKTETAALAKHAKILEEWKALPKDERENKPKSPIRLVVSDITTEGLLLVHARAPLGLLLYRDELGGWLRGFDQYKSGKGSDSQTWTEMHQGNPCIIDRKTSETLSVPRAAVSIVGGIQPEILQKAICGEHLFDGVASRILFIATPERAKQWNEETTSDEVRADWADLLNELLALQPNEDGTPIDLPMTAKAKDAWASYYEEHGKREAEEVGPLKAAMSKLEGATARLALVIQLAEDPHSARVGVEAMKGAIKISNWFEGQARRVYQGFEETEQERDRREACEWIASRGGSTTQRDFARYGPNRLRKRAGEILKDLVTADLAKCSRQEGHRAEIYVLCDCDSCDGETP